MSKLIKKLARLIDILPKNDKMFAFEPVKKMILDWDPDFTKVTADEVKKISLAEQSGFVDENDIDWDVIGTE